MENERDWMRAIEQTWVVRFPKQHLATFGSTNISYYVVTEPIYRENDDAKHEGVVRTGRVRADRPTVVTPTYALNLSGFSPEAYDYFNEISRESGPNSPGILYQYKNEAGEMDIVGGTPRLARPPRPHTLPPQRPNCHWESMPPGTGSPFGPLSK